MTAEDKSSGYKAAPDKPGLTRFTLALHRTGRVLFGRLPIWSPVGRRIRSSVATSAALALIRSGGG